MVAVRPQLHVFIGTKAQYIKTAPVLKRLDDRGVAYRLIDSGQHSAISATLRHELGVREPDVSLGGSRDVTSIPQALMWSLRLATKLLGRKKLRNDVFGGTGGWCVVHGDTPSTLWSTLLARRAGLRVAHLEAGLRSGNIWNPFPEELIRIVVMHLSSLLFAPDSSAVANLEKMRVRGRVVPLSGNTSADSLTSASTVAQGSGPVVVTMHRVENLHRASTVEAFIRLVERVAQLYPVRFVLHGPTRATLTSAGAVKRLEDAGIEMVDLVAHGEFINMLRTAPMVITDGGSIQEECALIGVPTLLWRRKTERSDGLDSNVVLSKFDPHTIDEFLRDPEHWRHDSRPRLAVSPSDQIAEELTALQA